MERENLIVERDAPILITGAAGFIGLKVVEKLLNLGFHNLICFARHSSNLMELNAIVNRYGSKGNIEILQGNLLSRDACMNATARAGIIFHLAAGGSGKSFPDTFMNTVVTTRNLLEASLDYGILKRFVNVSSFAVYSNTQKRRWRLLDESCPIEASPTGRGDAYCFAKVKQENIVISYGKRHGIPYVIVRPGTVFGPGKPSVPSRVGIDTFGIFLHLGGSNTVPLTYVDNCADAIVLAGLKTGVDGEVFNIVDDDLPTSRRFLRLHKKSVKHFKSIYIPHVVSHTFCYAWEAYSRWSDGQLPPVFNRRRWHAIWKKTNFTNDKLKSQLGWSPRISMTEALNRYFNACREEIKHA